MTPIQEIEIRTKNGEFYRVLIEKSDGYFVYGECFQSGGYSANISPTEKKPDANSAIIKFIDDLNRALSARSDEMIDLHLPCNDEFNVLQEIIGYVRKNHMPTGIRMNSNAV